MTFSSTFGRVFSPTFQPKSQAMVAGGAFSPTDITGCALWLDFSDADIMFTDAGSTKVVNDGDLIYQMNDKSGNSNHLTYTVNKPAYKVNIQNGKSVGRWGASTGLETKDNLALSWGANLKTLFFVLSPTSWDSTSNWVFTTSTGFNFLAWSWVIYDGGSRRWADSEGSSVCQLINLYHTDNNANTYVLYKDGSLQTPTFTSAGTIDTNASKLRLGEHQTITNRCFAGDFEEVIIYDGALSDTNRQSVETYLNNKWAIY